jgi:hypothetical protein
VKYSRVTVVQVDELPKVCFDRLAVGDFYDSHSVYGLCLKTSTGTAWSFTRGVAFVGGNNWLCRPVNVRLRYR